MGVRQSLFPVLTFGASFHSSMAGGVFGICSTGPSNALQPGIIHFYFVQRIDIHSLFTQNAIGKICGKFKSARQIERFSFGNRILFTIISFSRNGW
jgi:hypothetical protein